MPLPIPENFEKWSEDCKKKYKKLSAQYDEREALEEKIKENEQEVDKVKKKYKSSEKELKGMEKLLDSLKKLIKSHPKRLKKFEKELQEKLRKEFSDWKKAGNRTDAEIYKKKKELEDRYRKEVQDFKKQKKENKKEAKRLKESIPKKKKELQKLKKELEKKKNELKKSKNQLKKLPSDEKIAEDYYALIRKCGEQDPKPGAPSVPISNIETDDPFKLSFGYKFETPPKEKMDKEIINEEIDDKHKEVRKKRLWHEACVLVLWVEGTEPLYDKETHSNPITKTVRKIAADVNSIWAPCCVRFNFFLKVVSLKQLGKLSNKAKGVHISPKSKTIVADMDDIQKDYATTIKKLRDEKSKKCSVYLMVDQVGKPGGRAGFAGIGTGAGVSEVDGTTLAHEIGHAVGGIKHEGNGHTHAHGELMWGKGSVGFPKRKVGNRYRKTTAKDCESMRSKTTPTKEECKAV